MLPTFLFSNNEFSNRVMSRLTIIFRTDSGRVRDMVIGRGRNVYKTPKYISYNFISIIISVWITVSQYNIISMNMICLYDIIIVCGVGIILRS